MSDYVNGKALYAELKIYHAEYQEAMKAGKDKPQMSNMIAIALMQIATRLSNSHNFVNYTYKDEFVADGIIKCVHKVHRFDPEKGENPFAYFTQICWNAAINRIKIEQHQSSVKARLVRDKMSSEFVEHGADADSDDGTNSFVEFMKENDCFIDYEEIKKEKIKGVLVHRNKSGYNKKEVLEAEALPEFDLTQFEEEFPESEAA